MTLTQLAACVLGVIVAVCIVWFAVWHLGAKVSKPGREMDGYTL